MMIKNSDRESKKNTTPIGVYISDHPCRILTIVGFYLSKTNVVLNLRKHQRPEIDKICIFVKDPFESKDHFEKMLFKQKTKK